MSSRREARDEWSMIIDGKMKNDDSRRLHAELERLPPDVVAKIRTIAAAAVDTAIHHVLWQFEQARDIGIFVEREGVLTNVNELSDGLTADFAGWKESESDVAKPHASLTDGA